MLRFDEPVISRVHAAGVGTHHNVRFDVLDIDASRLSGMGQCSHTVKPDIPALGWDRLDAEQQKSRRAGNALRLHSHANCYST